MIFRCLVASLDYLRGAAYLASPELDSAINDEIEFHLSESTDDHIRAGLSPADARKAACDRFGSVERIVSECRAAYSARYAICHRIHTVVTAALCIAVAALLLTRSPSGIVSIVPLAEPGPHETVTRLTGDIRGQVIDEHERPIANANVLAVVKTWPDHGYRQQAHTTTTNAAGMFTIENVYPEDKRCHIQIATVADRRALRSTYLRSGADALKPIVFQLPATEAFALRIENDDGKRVAGAEVFPHSRVDSSGQDHMVYFDSADPIIRRSNEEGVVELPYFAPGDRATIYLRLPERDWRTHELVVPRPGTVVALRTEPEK